MLLSTLRDGAPAPAPGWALRKAPILSITEAGREADAGNLACLMRVCRQLEGLTPTGYRALRLATG